MNLYRAVSLWLLLLMLGVPETKAAGECDSPNGDSEECLDAIKDVFADQSRFWFGTSYNTLCAEPHLYCVKHSSIPAGSNMEEAAKVVVNNINRFLNVQFNSPAGSIEGCDTTIARNSDRTISLDPVSMETVQAWDTRFRPSFSWTSTDPSKKYTLIFHTPGHETVMALYTNIVGGSLAGHPATIDNADVVKEYVGSTSPYYRVSIVLGFYLYEQTEDLDIDDIPETVDLSEFRTTYQLNDPVAVNLLEVEGDVYAAQLLADQNQLQNCPAFVQRVLQEAPHNTRPFITPGVELSAFIHVEITTPEVTFELCCEEYTDPADDVTLDPIGNPEISATSARTIGSTLVIDLWKGGVLIGPFAVSFSGEFHTLLVVDPDAAFPSFGSNSTPILHMMVTNIQDGDMSTGDVISPYRGPGPPDDSLHTYYFLLFKQTAGAEFTFTLEDVENNYIDTSVCNICSFDIEQFILDNELELEGITWLTSTNNKYVDFDRIRRGRSNETEYCSANVAGWEPDVPCPTAASGVCRCFTSTIIMMAFVSSLYLLH